MKRVFLIVGISIILLLVTILLFLLFASDTQKKEIFNRFNLANNDSEEGIIDTIVDTITGDDSSGTKIALRQLTTKHVIGEAEIDQSASSTNPFVYFAEAGTGHIYSVDVAVGTENRLSNITIQAANKAIFSRDGNYALIASNGGREGQQLTLVTLPKDGQEVSSFTLSEPAKDFMFTEDGFILYSTTVGESLTVRSFNLAQKEPLTILSLPFKEATIRFGTLSTDEILVYPKTTEKLEGYIYVSKAGKLQRLPISGYGLNALYVDDMVLYSYISSGSYSSHLLHIEDSSTADLPISVLAEKCGSYNTFIICGSNNNYPRDTIEKWYKGSLFLNDDLWLIDAKTYRAENLITPKEIVARDFDVTNVHINRDISRIYFINETDHSLWLFDRAVSNVQ